MIEKCINKNELSILNNHIEYLDSLASKHDAKNKKAVLNKIVKSLNNLHQNSHVWRFIEYKHESNMFDETIKHGVILTSPIYYTKLNEGFKDESIHFKVWLDWTFDQTNINKLDYNKILTNVWCWIQDIKVILEQYRINNKITTERIKFYPSLDRLDHSVGIEL